jgi:hypothetical protein
MVATNHPSAGTGPDGEERCGCLLSPGDTQFNSITPYPIARSDEHATTERTFTQPSDPFRGRNRVGDGQGEHLHSVDLASAGETTSPAAHVAGGFCVDVRPSAASTFNTRVVDLAKGPEVQGSLARSTTTYPKIKC